MCREGRVSRAAGDRRLSICACHRGTYQNLGNLGHLRRLRYTKRTDNVVFLPYLQSFRDERVGLSHKLSSAAPQDLGLLGLTFQTVDRVSVV